MNADDTFMKITNRDVYEEIRKLREENNIRHSVVVSHLQVTNGKVKLNRWIATTALTLVLFVIFNLLRP